LCTGYSKKNGAISKVNKKSIFHLTRVKRTPSAAATGHISHVLPAVRFSCLLRRRGASFQDGVAAEKGFPWASFEVSRSVITVHPEFRAQFRTAGSAIDSTLTFKTAPFFCERIVWCFPTGVQLATQT
jgi:hypothetical protein